MRHLLFAILLILSLLPVSAGAVTPQFWENFSQEELLKGSFNHVSLTPDGKLLMGPAYDVFYDTGQHYIFSLVRDKSGNIFVGTGDEGKVFRVDPQGKGSLYFQSRELNIFAMALDSAGTLYVGTSPDGKVYKVTGPNQATEFCNPETKYIWSMIFDDAGNLYVGTGPNGVIYKVDSSGKKTAFYTCSDAHVRHLAKQDNRILAGTAPSGLVVQIGPEGKGFTLIDTPLEEVHALRIDSSGVIYALASSAKGLGTTLPSSTETTTSGDSTATVTIESVVTAIGERARDTKVVTAPGGEKGVPKSAVYAITRDGSTETIYSSDDLMAYDAILREDGSLMIAAGPKGRLLSVDTAKQVTVISDTADEDLTCLLAAGNVTYVGASNQGKLYRLEQRRAQGGMFESSILDAGVVSSWGKISWRTVNSAGGTVAISTRTGNTQKADASWSDWSEPYSAPGSQITSPRARYLQWRANFKGGSTTEDALDGVRIAYLQQNLRPQVISIDVLPFGVELQKQPSLSAGGLTMVTQATTPDGRSLNSPRERTRETQELPPRQVLRPGSQSFTWKAVDENNDSLDYSIFFRGDGESDWKLLAEKIQDNFYSLNAASLPDGTYRIKVMASDAPNNPFDRFLVGELVSDPFTISNTSPKVSIAGHKINGRRVELQFVSSVSTGRVATAEFSIDGGEWNLVFPADGIADSEQEEYRVTTPELSTGEHLIGIRTSDADGNTGTAKLVVRII